MNICDKRFECVNDVSYDLPHETRDAIPESMNATKESEVETETERKKCMTRNVSVCVCVCGR